MLTASTTAVHDCDSEDPADWTFLIIVTWKPEEGADQPGLGEDDDLLLARVLRRSEHLAYPFGDMLRAIPRGTKCWYGRMSYWPTKPWDNRGGRVTLAGDAAHAMTFRGRQPAPFWLRPILC